MRGRADSARGERDAAGSARDAAAELADRLAAHRPDESGNHAVVQAAHDVGMFRGEFAERARHDRAA